MLISERQSIVGMRHGPRHKRTNDVMDGPRPHKKPHDDACVPKAS